MRNIHAASATLIALLVPCLAFAGPADLLKQAIEEEGQVTRESKNPEVNRLVSQADDLLSQKKFDEAVDLYERAYRLDPANQANYARLLVAKRAAGRMTQQDREALELIEQQQAAEIDQVLRGVRLTMLQARQAIRAGDIDLARARLSAGGDMLDRLPAFVDVEPYRTELRRLETTANRKAVKQARPEPRVEADENIVTMTEMVTDDGPIVESTTETTYIETGHLPELDGLVHDDWTRHVYDRELATALAHQRAQVILSTNEAALPPCADLVYPDDWAEKSARRAKYRDGMIYRGESYTGEDGQEYYTAIYDLGDLVHPVPNFYATFPAFGYEQLRNLEDRYYLRERSWIFNRGAEDLAAGLPLLHFFGGVDNNAVSTRTDPREVERVIRTLETFLNR